MVGPAAAIALVLAFQGASFRTSTRLVQVNVVVLDKRGAAADLKKTGGIRKETIEVFLARQGATGNVLDQSHNVLNLSHNGEQYAAYLKPGGFFGQNAQAKDAETALRILTADPVNATNGGLTIPVSNVK